MLPIFELTLKDALTLRRGHTLRAGKWRPFGFLVIGLFVAGVSGCSKDTVRASRFELVDKHGRQRAALYLDDDGETPKLLLQDFEGRLRAALQFDKNGNPGLHLLDESGTRRVLVGLVTDHQITMPALVLSNGDQKEEVGFAVSVNAAGEPTVLLRSDRQGEAIRLSVEKERGASITIVDRTGAQRVDLPTQYAAPGKTSREGIENSKR